MARPRVFDEGEVLDRAMEVFWCHGYEGASMAELTAAMSLNSPSIYAAFGNKRGLFEAVLKRYKERRTAHRDFVLASATGQEVAHRMLFGAIEWLVSPREPLGCLLVQTGTAVGINNGDISRTIIDQRTKTRELITERLTQAQQDGDFPATEEPAALARYLIMVFNGLALHAADGMSKTQLRESATRALTAWPQRPRG